ncbi:hypothetical protein PINS_up001156 [Pythium insidiosum]|nr:hypothetical protein PINS_up001156 [Pythium insidiosum]
MSSTQGVTIPTQQSLLNLVQDFIHQLERKNQTIQDLVMNSNRTSKVQNKAELDLQAIEKRNAELQSALSSARSDINRLQAQLNRERDDHERQLKASKGSVVKLQQQLKVSEHRVKAKEVLVERMQKKLQQQVDKETMSKARDRKVFKNLQQREPRKANPRDNQSLECISVYEAQKEQMQDEIQLLRHR